MALVVSAQSGDWEIGSTWVGGNPPAGDGSDTAQIAAGHVVDVDSAIHLLGLEMGNGSRLNFLDGSSFRNEDEGSGDGTFEIHTDGDVTFIGGPQFGSGSLGLFVDSGVLHLQGSNTLGDADTTIASGAVIHFDGSPAAARTTGDTYLYSEEQVSGGGGGGGGGGLIGG